MLILLPRPNIVYMFRERNEMMAAVTTTTTTSRYNKIKVK